LGRVAEAYEQMTSGRVRFRVVLTFDGVPAVTEQ
jgi:D-arabinose 1-dehydrogenase-like Zn-dependent alcohol dehydrogenase